MTEKELIKALRVILALEDELPDEEILFMVAHLKANAETGSALLSLVGIYVKKASGMR